MNSTKLLAIVLIFGAVMVWPVGAIVVLKVMSWHTSPGARPEAAVP